MFSKKTPHQVACDLVMWTFFSSEVCHSDCWLLFLYKKIQYPQQATQNVFENAPQLVKQIIVCVDSFTFDWHYFT